MVRALWIVMIAVLVLGLCLNAAASDDECGLAGSDLQTKRQQLAETVAALQKASDENNLQVLELLNFKMDRLIEEIRQLEKKVEQCEAKQTRTEGSGQRSAKSEESKYATKSCEELRRLLVPLMRKVHTLQRREKSLFSEFTEGERAELDSALEEVKTVEDTLKARCSARPKPGRSKKPRKPAGPR